MEYKAILWSQNSPTFIVHIMVRIICVANFQFVPEVSSSAAATSATWGTELGCERAQPFIYHLPVFPPMQMQKQMQALKPLFMPSQSSHPCKCKSKCNAPMQMQALNPLYITSQSSHPCKCTQCGTFPFLHRKFQSCKYHLVSSMHCNVVISWE